MDKINFNIPIGFVGFHFDICPVCNKIWRQRPMKEKIEGALLDSDQELWYKNISSLCDQCWDIEFIKGETYENNDY